MRYCKKYISIIDLADCSGNVVKAMEFKAVTITKFILICIALNLSVINNAYSLENHIFVELFGSAPDISLNYEALFKSKYSMRIGYGQGEHVYKNIIIFDDSTSISRKYYNIPVIFNYLFGTGKHRLELGAGPRIVYRERIATNNLGVVESDYKKWKVKPMLNAFYRFQNSHGNFIFRVGLSMHITNFERYYVLPGLSVGFVI